MRPSSVGQEECSLYSHARGNVVRAPSASSTLRKSSSRRRRFLTLTFHAPSEPGRVQSWAKCLCAIPTYHHRDRLVSARRIKTGTHGNDRGGDAELRAGVFDAGEGCIHLSATIPFVATAS